MDAGTKISAVAHVGLIGWVMLEGVFSGSAPPPEAVRDVSVITAEDFAALTAPDVTVPDLVAPSLPAVAEQPEAPSASTVPAPVAPSAVITPPVLPVPPPPDPLSNPLLAPPQDTAVFVPPQPDLPEVPEPPRPTEEPHGLQQSDRVAPDPVPAPEEDVAVDLDAQDAVTPDEAGDLATETQDATAQEAASDRIVTEAEADDTSGSVPFQPPRLRPAGLTVPEPEPQPQPDPAPVAQPAPAEPGSTETAIDDAISQLLGETPAASAPAASAPAGPPLTAGERDGLRVAVSRCWNFGALSTDATRVTVIVGVSMARDGKPDIGSIRMLSYSGGSAGAAETAFQVARRAIIRCGASGFDLPAEKYDQWREIEMTFNPERMRNK